MKIDFNILLRNVEDTENLQNEKGEPIFARQFAVNALLTNDPKADAETKVKRWLLAQTIAKTTDGPVEVSPEELVQLRKLIGENYPPLVVGQMWEFLK